MACEYFSNGRYPLCEAMRGLMTPTVAQIRNYCASARPEDCPLYQSYRSTQEKIPLESEQRDE